MTWNARMPLALALLLANPPLPARAEGSLPVAPAEAGESEVVKAPETPRRAGQQRRSQRSWWAPLPDRGWLGVRLGMREHLEHALQADTLPEEWQRVLNTRWLLEEWDGKGALLSEVFPETPAEKAGLLPGDVIVSFNGIRTGSPGELSFIVQRAVKGRDGDIEVLRDGEVRRVLVEIGMHPEDARRLEDERKEQAAEKERQEGPGSPSPAGAP